MGKKKYRITNWADYNKALKQRGSLTVWMEKGFEKLRYAVKAVKRVCDMLNKMTLLGMPTSVKVG